MADYGTDISTLPDLDPAFALITGTRVVAESLARIFVTPQGSDEWHPNYGRDLRRFLNAPMDVATLAQVQAEAEEGALLDERVADATATASFEPLSGRLILRVEATLAGGPFLLVLAIGDVSTTILEARAT
jgi:phage baseplate assembly protein W